MVLPVAYWFFGEQISTEMLSNEPGRYFQMGLHTYFESLDCMDLQFEKQDLKHDILPGGKMVQQKIHL